MRVGRSVKALLALSFAGTWTLGETTPIQQYHQVPDSDGIYYTGPEVSAPKLVKTVYVPYPGDAPSKNLQGMTVMAMVIDEKGVPQHIQLLHSHGEFCDQASMQAVKQSVFEPGKLGDKPVPVWIDVRVVFRADRTQATPQVLITERDFAPPSPAALEDKHGKPLPYTAPIPIHTVDADFVDPFSVHPFVQVAVVDVLVGVDGLPKQARVVQGLGFGLDEKAKAAVMRYKFFPAMKHGKPVEASRNIKVNFTKF
jgi:hypothetical protein